MIDNPKNFEVKTSKANYKVEFTAKDAENKKDPQMDKAVELLLSDKF